jgi:lipopolysaccharide export system protein LptA
VAPVSVPAGKGVVIEAEKFVGDTKVTVVLRRGPAVTDLGTQTLKAGAATVFTTAPRQPGSYRVVATGVDSGVSRSAALTVRR